MPTENDFNALDNLTCNTEVHLQILTPTQAIRLRSKLIGVDSGRSIILAHGNDKAWLAAAPFVREHQSVIMRVVNSDEHDANILAFRSRIQKIISVVGRWIIIDYPKALQTVALRQHSRVPINVTANLVCTTTRNVVSHGNLRDISIKGGAFVGDEIEGFELGRQYLLQVDLEGQDDSIETLVTLKNQQDAEGQTGQIQYGLILETEHDETEKMVQKVILHHLLQNPKNQ
ncbi:flagellar brake protein [Shewanella gelidimarina]|uniref:PilZ domain-containing protein n=1 Tax=Shewanella gelidimarina TaxID=56813 RepID=UPI00200E0B45|nr:PilZ domain-containing protein [Shewanella gelidimarina]MCL1056596.1 flagellar brake protein [Shewanella gelidimarina]